MAEISDLKTLAAFDEGDWLFLYQTKNADARKVSLVTLLDFLQDSLTFANGAYEQQYFTVSATGWSVTIADNATKDIWAIITQGAYYVAGAITMPTAPFDGQELLLMIVNENDGITVDWGGKSALAGTTLIVEDPLKKYRFRFHADTNTWHSVGW